MFCGGTPVSQEHLLPRWLSEHFTDDIVDFHLTIELDGSDPEVRPWSGRPFSTTVGGPCRSCNNGWMSDLERRARPLLARMIRGERVTLGVLDVHRLGRRREPSPTSARTRLFIPKQHCRLA